ncbi:ABC transporter ATP-binding protein [Mangrovibacillus sp. Mu-81]|jgi:ABC-2 type transport system ATP-binding protein|uniref:ABC transporter ATP-binding protein n=1 Tax=Mangrovibacillus sp. Mu-81 TaxID=3121478 RepID=UPI002FE468AF
MSQPTVDVQHVTKKIKKAIILDDITFTLSKGEVFGLVGPNGAGKTTLMKMIVGLTSCTSGDIHVLGNSMVSHRMVNLTKIGAIIETPSFYDFFSGWENLRYFSLMHSDCDQDKINSVLDLVGLKEEKDKAFKKYSLGMKQRLGIANALLHDPEFLILDEPTSTLDPLASYEFRSLIKQLNKEHGMTILISSHNLKEIEEVCHRYAILSEGKIKSINEIKTIQVNETITLTIHLDQPEKARNLLAGHHEVKDVKLRKDGKGIEVVFPRSFYTQVVSFLISNQLIITSISEVEEGVTNEYYKTFMAGGER